MSTGTAVATTEDHAKFAPSRLPWHPVIEERFGAIGATRATWKALTEAVFPGAKSVDSVVMALSYCAARKLDPFKRPVHIVPMWDSQSRQMVETVWPGISEIRTTAFRTGQYAGCDEVEFGPMVERTFTGMVGKRGSEREVSITVTFPEWGRINVYRILNSKVCKFVSPKVYWLESYGRQGASDVPNDMWAKRPSGQLEKCVEAAGLRKAFPEEVGNDYTAEEMHGQALLSEATPSAQIAGPAAPPPPPTAQEEPSKPAAAAPGPAAPPAEQVEEAEIVEAPSPAQGGGNAPAQEDDTPLRTILESVMEKPEAQVASQDEEVFDSEAWLDEVRDRFAEARTPADVDGVHEIFGDTATEVLSLTERQKYQDMHEAAEQRVAVKDQPEQAEVTGEPGPAPDEDDDDGFPGADAIQPNAPRQRHPGEEYKDRIWKAINDPIRTQSSLEGLWNATTDERKALVADGHLSKEERKELHAAIAKRGEERIAKEQGGPAAPPAEGDKLAAYDRSFRDRVAACETIEQINALSTGTLAERAEFQGDPIQKKWQEAITLKRKQISGIA